MEKQDNYFLNVNWTGLKDDDIPVGYFILYNQKFYFKICSEDTAPRAYKEGFGGRPGIKVDEIYCSSEVFDTINKIFGLNETGEDKIEILKDLLLKIVNGVSTVENQRDRLSFGEMSQRFIEIYKSEIDEFEKAQAKKEDTGR